MGIIESWKSRSERSVLAGSPDQRLMALFEAGHPNHLLDKVTQLQDSRDDEAALRLLRAGVVRYQPWAEGEKKLALLERQHARRHLAHLQDAAENEFSALTASRLADTLDILGDTSGWKTWTRAAIGEDPCDPEGYLAVARSHLRRFCNFDDAVAGRSALRYLTKACQLGPGHGECLRDLATLLLNLNAPRAAAKVLAPLTRAAPGDPMVIALTIRSSELPPESTSNVHELFLRWETGVEPTHSPEKPNQLTTQQGFDLWEISTDRSVVATSTDADLSPKTLENYAVLVGTLQSAMPQMGMGDFIRFTSRGSGGILMGKFEDDSTLIGHTSRASHENQLSRLLEQEHQKEVRR